VRNLDNSPRCRAFECMQKVSARNMMGLRKLRIPQIPNTQPFVMPRASRLQQRGNILYRALRFHDVLQLSVRDKRCGCCDSRCSLAGHLPGLGASGDHKTVIVPRVPHSPQNALFSVPQHVWLVMRCGEKRLPTKAVETGDRVGAFGVLEGGHSRRSAGTKLRLFCTAIAAKFL